MTGKLPLSKQEEKVLNTLAKGLLYKEIATELNISINTVKKHLKNIYRKLEVTNRKHATNINHGMNEQPIPLQQEVLNA